MLERLIELLASASTPVLALAAAGLAFSETAIGLDLVVPGEAGMVASGAAAAQGAHPVALLVVAAACGAFLGDTVSYLIGRRWGLVLVDRWRPVRRRLRPAVERGERAFERHGGKAVFLGRWIGGLRAVVPAIAGTVHMPARRFLLWNAAASIAWASTMVSLGYVVGRPAARAVDALGPWSFALLAVLAIGAILWHRRPGKGQPDPGPAPDRLAHSGSP